MLVPSSYFLFYSNEIVIIFDIYILFSICSDVFSALYPL